MDTAQARPRSLFSGWRTLRANGITSGGVTCISVSLQSAPFLTIGVAVEDNTVARGFSDNDMALISYVRQSVVILMFHGRLALLGYARFGLTAMAVDTLSFLRMHRTVTERTAATRWRWSTRTRASAICRCACVPTRPAMQPMTASGASRLPSCSCHGQCL
jgi:hypothetical protein